MTKLNLSVLGLNRVGISIGMALAKNSQDIHTVGFDQEKKIKAQVEKRKIFSATTNSLKDAVQSADVVVISLPLDEVQVTFKDIATLLINEAMIVYCGWLPGKVAKWAQEILPGNVFFTALTPAFNPKYIKQNQSDEPSADLFDHSLMFVSHLPIIPPAVVETATALTKLLGATPYFSDLLEVDGFQTLTHILPSIAAAAVMLEVENEPGWEDARKLAGENFAYSTLPLDHLMESYDLGQSLLLNGENSLRIIGNLQAALAQLGTLISEGKSEELKTILENMIASRNSWLKKRNELAEATESKKKK